MCYVLNFIRQAKAFLKFFSNSIREKLKKVGFWKGLHTRTMPMLTILMVLGIQGSVVQQVFAVCVCCTALVSCQNYMSKLYPTVAVPGVTKRGGVKITFTFGTGFLERRFLIHQCENIFERIFIWSSCEQYFIMKVSWTLVRMILPPNFLII